MELVFIRHGQGEHTLNLPYSIYTTDPSLTKEGIIQARELRSQFPISEDDIVIISPIRRALQTAMIWTEGISPTKLVSPLISPRIFPLKQDSKTLPCDHLLTREKIRKDFPDFILDKESSLNLWIYGINIIPENEFILLAKHFLEWCKKQDKKRIYLVSHDGQSLLTNNIFWVKNCLEMIFRKKQDGLYLITNLDISNNDFISEKIINNN